MTKVLHAFRLAAGTVLVASVLFVAPLASASHGSDDAVSSTSDDSSSSSSGSLGSGLHSTSSNSGSGSSGSSSHLGEGLTASSSGSDDSSDDVSGNDSLHDRAEKLLDDKRQNGKQKSEAARQKACIARADHINDRFTQLHTKATKFLNRYDAIFTNVQSFQGTKQLDVSNYDTLVADVTAKQTAAKAAVDALTTASDTKIDCTSADPASSVATVKTAAQDTKTALQAYRTALHTLVHALIDADGPANGIVSPKAKENSTKPETTTSGDN